MPHTRTTQATRTKAQPALAVGDWVALSLRPGAAPLRCYVGQIEAIDSLGLRLTLVDWLTGTASGYDLFVRWAALETALVCTPAHDLHGFAASAEQWQERMQALGPRTYPCIEESLGGHL